MGKKHKDKKKNHHQGQKQLINIRDDTKLIITREENPVDFLSSLPNDILCCIISLLPFKSAVKTGFLATRWRHLWKITSERTGTLDDAADAVFGFYEEFYYEPNNLRGLQFIFGKGNVLLCSVSPGGNTLHLDFSTGKQEYPLLFRWDLVINFRIPSGEPYHCIKLITNLHLVSVMHHTAGAISSLASKFPFLESLTIAKCRGLQSLSITATPRLLKLSVFDCPGLTYFRITATCLKSLLYRGLLPEVLRHYGGFMEDAMLDLRKGSSNSIDDFYFGPKLFSLRSVKTLTLCRWTYEALIYPHRRVQFSKLEELWWIDYENDEKYNSDALISFLKLCPLLERLSVTISPKPGRLIIPCDCSTQLADDTIPKRLKFVKLDGFRNEEDMISLAKQLKEVFFVEPKIVATSNEISVRSLVKALEIQEGESGESDYKFVKEVRHVNQLCPKHPHMRL